MGQSPPRIALLALMGVILLESCGTLPTFPHPDRVSVTITPAQTEIAVGGTVTLKGTATGFTETPTVEWWIQEARDANANDDCGYLQGPLMSRCQFGFVIFGSVTRFPSSANYYAPLTPGTYHVTFQATQFATFDRLSKTATATITVMSQ